MVHWSQLKVIIVLLVLVIWAIDSRVLIKLGTYNMPLISKD